MTMDVIICGLLLILSAVLSNGLYNAALYKPAIQSSIWQPYRAEHGVDGKYNVDNFDDFCQHTQNDSIPWWMVDLRGRFVIEKITLLN
ncbi:fucolectin-5, partial [Biomphalaria glabrata]